MFGGEPAEKGSRIFLKGSREIYQPSEIAGLATELGDRFEASTELTVELENFTVPEQEQSNLPSNKILPIPGKLINRVSAYSKISERHVIDNNGAS